MMLEFTVKQHFGRVDLYPSNEAARLVVRIKQAHYSGLTKTLIKCISLAEVELFKQLGHEVRLIQEFDVSKLKSKIG